MKNLVQNLILVIALTIAILFSYAYVQDKVQSIKPSDLYHFLKNELSILQSEDNKSSDNLSDKPDTYHAVWLSYLEFKSYRNSVKTNNEETFREFFQRVLDQCAQCDINRLRTTDRHQNLIFRLILQVKPSVKIFADLLTKL